MVGAVTSVGRGPLLPNFISQKHNTQTHDPEVNHYTIHAPKKLYRADQSFLTQRLSSKNDACIESILTSIPRAPVMATYSPLQPCPPP